MGISSIEDYNKVRLQKCKVVALAGRCHDASSDLTLTVRKNGADTLLTGTLTATGAFRITSGGPIDFADGDEMSIYFDCDVGGGNAIGGLIAEMDVEGIA